MNAQPQYITDANGEKMAVILPLADYQELMEDLEDLAAIAERKDEPAMPLEAALKAIGLQ
jgi:PHD/YefM family antitoxin component YafN of YafNO toxin-antitoxin module